MLNNYFKIAWRNLWKNKVYSILNISGLAIGMSVALIIGLWVMKELSYNKFLPKYKQLHQVLINYTSKQRGTVTQSALAIPLLEVLKNEIPEIKNAVMCDWINEHSLMVGDRKVFQDGAMIGPEFLTMFEYPLLKGNAASALKETYSIVLTESTAKALFGNADPMNKMVRIDNQHDLMVTGVLKDVPDNSTLHFNYLVPFNYYAETTEWVKNAMTRWTNQSNQLFVELQPGVTPEQVESKIKNLQCIKNPKACPYKPELFLHSVKDWNLYTDFEEGKSVGGLIDYIRMFGIIGALVLIIACINFMNLSTARSSQRAKEVGVRKAIGSYRRQLILQFLSESILLALIAFTFSLIIVQLSIPFFNTLTGSSIHIPFANGVFWVIMLGYVLFTGIVAGSRPAFYLSAFQPAQVLKGTVQSVRSAAISRKVLVVIQFTCSIGLIISTLIIYQQLQYAQNRSNGYTANRLLSTYLSKDLERNYAALKSDLLQSGMVEHVAAASTPMTHISHNTVLNNWSGKKAGDQLLNTGTVRVSPDYFKTVGMEMKSGRDFSTVPESDTISAVVNEAAVSAMGMKEPVGQLINLQVNESARIIGVVKNPLMGSPYDRASPIVFTMRQAPHFNVNFIFYRLSPKVNTQQAVAAIARIFDKYNPAYPHEYTFADDDYQHKFYMETLVGKLAGIFASIAVFISCLGLFGLAAYTAEQRKKEIGVRKVLGASVMQLWVMLCKDFILLVLISCVIASPIVFYFLQNWLQKYEYRISIAPGVFVLSGIAALCITMITISFQAIKAAVSNPVKSLRTE